MELTFSQMVTQLSQHENNLQTVQGRPHISVNPGATVLESLALTDMKFTSTGEGGGDWLKNLPLMKICSGLSTGIPVQKQLLKKEKRSPFSRLQSDPCKGLWNLLSQYRGFYLLDRSKSGTCVRGDAYQSPGTRTGPPESQQLKGPRSGLPGRLCVWPSLPQVSPSIPKSSLFGTATPRELGVASQVLMQVICSIHTATKQASAVSLCILLRRRLGSERVSS